MCKTGFVQKFVGELTGSRLNYPEFSPGWNPW